MRKLFIVLFALSILVQHTVTAQVSILQEGFDNTTFPPTGWQSITTALTGGSGQPTWYRVTTGSSPTASPYAGAGMASYNMFSINSGSKTEMSTPLLNIPGGSEVSFWLYRDPGYAGYSEGVRVYVGATNSSTGATLLGTVHRTTNMSPVVSTTGWYQYTFPIPVTGLRYIIFEGFSAYGNNMFLDEVNVYYLCGQPAGLSAPNVQQNIATVSWSPVAASIGYDYVLSQSATPPSAGIKSTGNTAINYNGLSSGTTYYFHVRNTCAGGGLSPWSTVSFSTPAGPFCAPPSNLVANIVTSTVVNLNWTAAASALNYEYVIDELPTDPTSGYTQVTGTSAVVGGLSQLTSYYAHVRAVCGNNYSAWISVPFTTPECKAPVNVLFSNITDTTADMVWSLMPNVQQYEYKVDISLAGQYTNNNSKITSGITANITNLAPDTKYYVFIRSRCFAGIDSSSWKIDSFVTSSFCGAPVPQIASSVNDDRTITWNEVPTGILYEYDLSGSATPPAFGTTSYNTSATVTLSGDRKNQYFHVRSKCNSMFTFSKWSTLALRTTGITDVNSLGQNIEAYPNPVSGILNISVNGASQGGQVTITDITGKVLRAENVTAHKFTMDVSGLAPGVYILKYSNAEGSSLIKIQKL